MKISRDVKKLYDFLVKTQLPLKHVVSYTEAGRQTGIRVEPPDGGPIKVALGTLFKICDEMRLPPLPSIVVRLDSINSANPQYGIPGGGYLVSEATSLHHFRDRLHPPEIERWKRKPRPNDSAARKLDPMIRSHQDMVWNFPIHLWPESIGEVDTDSEEARRLGTGSKPPLQLPGAGYQKVYQHLITKVLPKRRVISYWYLGSALKIPATQRSNILTSILSEMFRVCDALKLPPLPSIVVKKDSEYGEGKHGEPSQGYVNTEAISAHVNTDRYRPQCVLELKGKLKITESEQAEIKTMIESHQNMVWAYTGDWPSSLPRFKDLKTM